MTSRTDQNQMISLSTRKEEEDVQILSTKIISTCAPQSLSCSRFFAAGWRDEVTGRRRNRGNIKNFFHKASWRSEHRQVWHESRFLALSSISYNFSELVRTLFCVAACFFSRWKPLREEHGLLKKRRARMYRL